VDDNIETAEMMIDNANDSVRKAIQSKILQKAELAQALIQAAQKSCFWLNPILENELVLCLLHCKNIVIQGQTKPYNRQVTRSQDSSSKGAKHKDKVQPNSEPRR